MTNQLSAYKSNISIREYRYKLYVDPQYGEEQTPSVVNYAILSNKWSIEDISEDNTVKIIHNQTGDSISLSFNSFKDKLAFASNIYSAGPIKQVGKGHDIENLANMHQLYPRKRRYNIKEENIFMLFSKIFEGENIFKKIEFNRPIKKIKTIFRKVLLAS